MHSQTGAARKSEEHQLHFVAELVLLTMRWLGFLSGDGIAIVVSVFN